MRERMFGGAAGTAVWSRGYQDAVIKFKQDFMEREYGHETAQVHEKVVVHEHVHLLLARLDDIAHDKLGSRSAAYRAYCKRSEEVVDELSELFMQAYDKKRRS